MSHSQNGEDVIVREIFRARGKDTGNLLEVGAWNGVDLSNSRLLIEAGWNAVLVEPSPKPCSDLVRLYGSERDRTNTVDIIAAAVSVEQPHLKLMFITDDAVSTDDFNRFIDWKPSGGYYGKLHVPTITFDQILQQFGGFDFVSIDTEGSSVDLAIAYLGTRQQPTVMCVEHDNRTVELMQVAQAANYKLVHLNGENAILEYGA